MYAEPTTTHFYWTDTRRVVVEEIYDLNDPDCPVTVVDRQPDDPRHLLKWRIYSVPEFTERYGTEAVNYVPI
jgi:hypothetical protein